jgi:hypothetical protein
MLTGPAAVDTEVSVHRSLCIKSSSHLTAVCAVSCSRQAAKAMAHAEEGAECDEHRADLQAANTSVRAH